MQSRHRAGRGRLKSWIRRRGAPLCLLICCAALGLAAGAGLLRGHAQSAPPPAPTTATGASEKVASAPAPAAGQQEKPPAGITAEDAQKQEVANECADLLKMATDLKSAVDKTTKDTLSIAVVRKAGAIEQLAHKVRTGSAKD
jgi:type VI protein secretion system component VasF